MYRRLSHRFIVIVSTLFVYGVIFSFSVFAADPKIEFFEENGQTYIRIDMDPFSLSEEKESKEITPILIINNRGAGNGDPTKDQPQIKELKQLLTAQKIPYADFAIDRKRSPEENAEAIAQKIRSLNSLYKKPIGIVIAGGDGTYTKVVSGILSHCDCLTENPKIETFEEMIAFIALPPRVGTANDIGNVMGSSKDMDVFFKALQEGPIIPIRFPIMRRSTEPDKPSITFHLDTVGLSGDLFRAAERSKGGNANFITRRFPRLAYFFGLPISIVKATSKDSIFHYKLTVTKDGKEVVTQENESILYGLASLPILGSIGTVKGCRIGTGEKNPRLAFINVKPIESNPLIQLIRRVPFLLELFGSTFLRYFGYDPYKSDTISEFSKRISLVDHIPIEGTPGTIITIKITKRIGPNTQDAGFSLVTSGDLIDLKSVGEPTGNIHYEEIVVSFPKDPNADILVSRESPLYKEHVSGHIQSQIDALEKIYNRLFNLPYDPHLPIMEKKEKDKVLKRLAILQQAALKKAEKTKIADLIDRFTILFNSYAPNIRQVNRAACGRIF